MEDRPSPPFPSPDERYPIILSAGTTDKGEILHKGTVFLKAAISHNCIDVGDYSYASAFDPPEDWASHLAPYLFPFSPERLVIGKFCQIADGVKFITASANHRYDGFSSYPFFVFGGAHAEKRPSRPAPGANTIIGNDVWIGQGATILPGARIGDGVIVGAGSAVSGDIPDYSIVAGNKAQVVKKRFDDLTITRLKAVAWWDWPIAAILRFETEIAGADIDALENAKRRLQD